MTDLTRRAVLGLAAAAAALSVVSPVFGQSTGANKVFVLVHGAWHGGWCWAKVADLLRAQGHRVFTPTLSGLGERSHLLSEAITLYTHITDVIQVLEYEDLADVVLVGHSYAGMVITGVANAATGRIGRLVYLDAILVEPGQAMGDLGEQMAAIEALAEGAGVPPMLTIEQLGITDAEMAAYVGERLDPQPLNTMTQPLDYDPEVVAALPRTYIQTSEGFAAEADKARADGGFEMLAIEGAGHDVMLTEPETLAEMLISLT